MFHIETSLLANPAASGKSVCVKRFSDESGLEMADIKLVQEATAILITAPRAKRLVGEIRKAVEEYDRHPMAFSGSLEPLNTLIDLGLESPRALERVLDLVATKRELAKNLKKSNYQRDYMTAQRHRRYKAAELWELLNGPFPTAEDRHKHMNSTHRRWMRALDDQLASKGPLSWEQRIEEKRAFWAGIDATLDENLAEAKRRKEAPEAHGPAKRRFKSDT